jgi:hypothetical protein
MESSHRCSTSLTRVRLQRVRPIGALGLVVITALAAQPAAGQSHIRGQFWSRDTPATGSFVSGGLRYTIAP